MPQRRQSGRCPRNGGDHTAGPAQRRSVHRNPCSAVITSITDLALNETRAGRGLARLGAPRPRGGAPAPHDHVQIASLLTSAPRAHPPAARRAVRRRRNITGQQTRQMARAVAWGWRARATSPCPAATALLRAEQAARVGLINASSAETCGQVGAPRRELTEPAGDDTAHRQLAHVVLPRRYARRCNSRVAPGSPFGRGLHSRAAGAGWSCARSTRCGWGCCSTAGNMSAEGKPGVQGR